VARLAVDIEQNDIGVGDDRRLMSAKSMASFTLLSKNSTACLLLPLLVCVRLLSRYDKTFRSATYQNQKNPEIQIPIFPVDQGSSTDPLLRDTRI